MERKSFAHSLRALVVFSILLFSQSSFAATASAELGLLKFEFFESFGAPIQSVDLVSVLSDELSLISRTISSTANPSLETDTDDRMNWTTSYSSTGTISSSEIVASGDVSISTIGSNLSAGVGPKLLAESGIDSNTSPHVVFSEASSFLSGTLLSPGDGFLLITAPYTIKAEVMDQSLYGAFSSVFLNTFINGTNVFSSSSSSVSTDFFGSGSAVLNESDELFLLLSLAAGDTISFSAEAFTSVTSNPVPVPATFWLFGSGLAMLFMRRSKIF